MSRIIPSDKQTDWRLHCHTCRDERLHVCLTPIGVQVWCTKCDHNVAHFDFRGYDIAVNIMTGPAFGTRVRCLVEDQINREYRKKSLADEH